MFILLQNLKLTNNLITPEKVFHLLKDIRKNSSLAVFSRLTVQSLSPHVFHPILNFVFYDSSGCDENFVAAPKLKFVSTFLF